MNTKQQGFSVVEALLIVILVSIMCFTGWFVYKSQKKTNRALNNASQAQGEPQKATSAPSSLPNNTQYLEIKEMGIKINLGSNLAADTYYEYSNNDATLISRKIKAVFPNCTIEQIKGGDIHKTTDVTELNNMGGGTKPNTQIDGAYYYLTTPQNINCPDMYNLSQADRSAYQNYLPFTAAYNVLAEAVQHLEKL